MRTAENSILKNSVRIKAKHEKESARGLKRIRLAKRNMLTRIKNGEKIRALTKSISRQPKNFSAFDQGSLQSHVREACVPIANREMLLRLRLAIDEEWYPDKI